MKRVCYALLAGLICLGATALVSPLLGQTRPVTTQGSDAGRFRTEGVPSADRRLQNAELTYRFLMQRFELDLQNLRGHGEEVYTWSRRWMEAALAVTPDPEQRRTALEAHLERLRDRRDLLSRHGAGDVYRSDVAAAEYYIAEAELLLQAEIPRK